MKLLQNPIIYEQDKNGNPMISKFNGKPQCRVQAIFEGDNKQRTMSFFENISLAKSWKAGDDLDVIFSENEYNGRTFYNFKLATKNDKAMLEINKLKDFIRELIKQNGLKMPVRVSGGANIPPTTQTPLKSNQVASRTSSTAQPLNDIDIPTLNKQLEENETIPAESIPF